MLSVHAKKTEILFKILQAQCVGCRDCERVCPAAAISFVRGKAIIDIESCNGCSKCYSVCSYGAVNKCDIEEN